MELTPDMIIRRDYEAVEKTHKDNIKKLHWGDFVDVLYSFVGIISLGLYIKNKGKYDIWNNGKIAYRIKPKGQKVQQLGTINNLNRLLDDNDSEMLELLNNEYIIEFAKVYDSVGNLIPIWPGGNEFKGKAIINGKYAYDIPNIFFKEYGVMQKMYLEKVLNISVKDAALERFLSNKSVLIESVEQIQAFDENEYYSFIKMIVEEIKTRSEELKKKI